MITGKNITKSFEGRTILNGVNLTMEQGKITCLIGPSGSGKTTLLRALSLLEYPDKGDVSIEGKLYKFPSDQTKLVKPWPEVTVVFQSLFLWPHMTLRRNIMLPAKRAGLPDVHKRMDELIEFFEMGPFIDRYPNEASRGQHWRHDPCSRTRHFRHLPGSGSDRSHADPRQ